MCRPDYFTVVYRINPWMDPQLPTDTSLAVRQWDVLLPDLPRPRLRRAPDRPDRRPARHGLRGQRRHSSSTTSPTARASPTPSASPRAPPTWTGSARTASTCACPRRSTRARATSCSSATSILAGTGFRSASNSHEEIAGIYGREVVTLNLVNPSFYHLDTAIAVLDSTPGQEHIAYLPSAFDEPSLDHAASAVSPTPIIVTEEDAAVLGLNSFSDGYNVVIASRADGLRAPAARARLQPDRRRPLRAAARRRRREVLHPGAAPMTTDTTRPEPPTSSHEDEAHAAHNYHPLPVVVAIRRRRLGHRRRRQALPRLPRRVLGRELRALQPGAARGRAAPSSTASRSPAAPSTTTSSARSSPRSPRSPARTWCCR